MAYDGFFDGKCVAVTGAVGTVGRAIVEELLKEDVAKVIAIDNNESDLYFLGDDHRDDKRLDVFLSDICDENVMRRRLRGVDYVLHCAAFKHVPLCEMAPNSAVRNNILGTQAVINASRANQVKKVLFTSSDKAVNPTNVMGTTKLMGERLITAANIGVDRGETVFASTRFGNVVGSRGSVFPIFRDQILAGKNLTLTHPEMTRFMMTLEESVRLVLRSLVLSVGGEVYVTKMPVFNIGVLGEAMKRVYGPKSGRDPASIKTEVTSLRPGEKLYEELTTGEEVARSVEVEDFICVKPPASKSVYASLDYSNLDEVGTPLDRVYSSETEPHLGEEECIELFRRGGLL